MSISYGTASYGERVRSGRRFGLLLTASIVALLSLAGGVSAQPVPFHELNTEGDDYAAAFRRSTGGQELWYTTSSGFAELRSRRLMRAAINESRPTALDPQPLAYPVNILPLDRSAVIMDGCPAFSYCDTERGVFVSNRTVDGKYYENDLYEMVAGRDGSWTVSRLDALDSASWDDTPTLSPDGRHLYFSSDRRMPGSLLTDIFLSTRNPDGSWSAPALLEGTYTRDYAEQTPYAAADGYLYYATNQTIGGDYDIWRVRRDPATGQTVGHAEPVDMAGVNADGSDEGHPLFSPGGTWFLFSSNRGEGGIKDYDIFSLRLPEQQDSLILSVQLRTRKSGEDRTDPFSTTVHITDLAGGGRSSLRTNDRGETTIPIVRPRQADPSYDQRFRRLVITADSPSRDYIASTDTLLVDLLCVKRLSHTLYLWDTAALRTDSCVQDFRIKNVRFFVTGYWCPTTMQFADYAPCTSVFPDSLCARVDYQEPKLNCEENEIYRYALKFEPPQVSRMRQPNSACIDLREIADPKVRDFRAREVDSAIVKLVEAMRSALEYDCVQRAIRDGKNVNVEVVGWTDPRPLDKTCAYTGPDIDLNASFVKLRTGDSPYIVDGILKGGTGFRESKAGGNQLLSQLRAYYTALLLDRVWEERVPDYKRFKNSGLLKVEAIGRAISQETVAMEQQRSVSVLVSVPMENLPVQAGFIPEPGRFRRLCDSPCP